MPAPIFPEKKLKFRCTFKRQLNLLNVCRIYLQNILYPFAFFSTPNWSRCIEVGQYLLKKSCLNGFVWLLCVGFLCCILFVWFVGPLQQWKYMKTGYICSWPVAPYDLFPSLSAKNAHLKLRCVPPNIQALQAVGFIFETVWLLICACSVVTNFTVLILQC